MYIDRTTNMSDLLGSSSPSAPDRADVDERLALVTKLREKYRDELVPALRSAARAHFTFAKAAAKAGAVYRQFDGHGLDVPAPASLMVTPDDLAALARTYLAAGLIEPNDPLFQDMTFSG